MSYLNSLRLHFFGKFQAAVSTVNNDPTHFDNATFQKSFQERPEGWWNPRGDANWRMVGCKITSAWLGNGEAANSSDSVLTCSIADSDRTVAAKLVDLDPAQQGVSEIWGMQIRIADSLGNTLMRAKYVTAAFMDMFLRVPTGGGDSAAGAMYQSVLTDIEWGRIDASPVLQQLRAAASDGLLSIKFNVDAFDADFQSPAFTWGRVAGTIGPATVREPRHFIVGRHLMTPVLPQPGFVQPAGQINFCPAVVDEKAARIYLDLGNSLPTVSPGGAFTDLGELTLAYLTTDAKGKNETILLGNVDYRSPDWYETTAGVVPMPLTEEELTSVKSNPLAILRTPPGTQAAIAIAEPPGGLYVRPDQFVFRMNPGDVAEIGLFGSAFGEPLPHARVICFLDPTQIGGGPAVGVPENALEFPRSVVLNAFGQAKVQVTARNPANPRGYIDGQVYGVRCVLEDTLPPVEQYPFNPSELASFLVWDEFDADPPVWYGCLQPIFQQYANLYPIMNRFLDLSSYDSICQHRIPLSIAFGLNAMDPNAMPVTRDLSAGKREAILRWLTEVGPDGKPLTGTPAPALESSRMAIAPEPVDPKSMGKEAFYKRVSRIRSIKGARS